MKKTLHIIARNLSEREINDIIKTPESSVFWHFGVVRNTLPNNEYKGQLKAEDKKRINYETIDLLLRFSDEKINETTISDLLEYEKLNFWFYQRLTVYMAARNIKYLLEECKLAARDYNLILYSDLPNEILDLNLPDHIKHKYSLSDKSGFPAKSFSIGLAMLSSFGRVFFRSPRKIKGKHLILDNAKPQKILLSGSPGTGIGNFVLQNLFYKLDNRFCLIREAGIPGKRIANISDFRSSEQYRRQNLSYISSDLIMFRTMLSFSAGRKIRALRKELREKIDLACKSFSGSEFSLLTHLLSGQDSSFRVYITRYIGFKELCKKHKPLSISSADENSPYNKCLLDAAKSSGVKSLGIQHGAIHELHPAYRLTVNEAAKGIAPDITLLWGEHCRDILVDTGNFDASSILITGQLRTDTIPLLKTTHNSTSGSKKILLFASQPQRDPSLRRKAAEDLFKSASLLKGLSVWLKPHPLEKDYMDYYGLIARENNLTSLEYYPDCDLYQLIHDSDAVFTCFSTVGAEAVYFSKPLIIHDPLNQDIQGYISAGVGFQVRDEESCLGLLNSIIDGSLIQDKESVKSFVKKYAYQIDGSVSDRVLNHITDDS